MFNKMFAPYLTLEAHIEAFQETKRGLTDKIITDPTLNKAAHDYIDAQTEFAKMLAHNFTDIAKYSMDAISDKWFPQKEEVVEAKTTRSKTATA
jgi:hypothetical protein